MVRKFNAKTFGIWLKLVQMYIMLILLCSIFVACSNNNVSNAAATETNKTIDETTQEIEFEKETTTIQCEVDGCTKAGYYTIEGFSGETEYYCSTHYIEIQDMLTDLYEDTVTCEKDGCNKEGTYAIEGFSGTTEYYCYTHYNDIQEMIDSLFDEPDYGSCDNCGRPATYEWDENTAYCDSCFESLIEYILNN